MCDSSVNGSCNLSLVLWNVKGLGHVIKRGRVFSHLKTLKPDIIFLQETHIGPNEQRRLRANWLSQVFQGSFYSQGQRSQSFFAKIFHFALTV